MKKIFTLLMISTLSIVSVAAQSEYETEQTELSTTQDNLFITTQDDVAMPTVTKPKSKSGLEIDYVVADKLEGAHTVGANLVLGFLALGTTFSSFDEVEGIEKQSQFSLSGGINKRLYIIGRFLYADVRFGAYYQNYSCTISNSKNDPEKIKGYGAYINPRVGMCLFKNFAITAGYRCNFYDFDFSNEGRSSNMTLGIGLLF